MTPGKPGQSSLSDQTTQSAAATLKASVLSQLSSGIAHEINNPLTIILGHAENLIASAQKGFVPAPEIQKGAGAILQSTLRVSQIVRGFRNFARDGSLDPIEPTQFHAIFERVTALCRARFRNHDVELHLELPSQELTGYCRTHEMEQCLFYILCVMFDTVLEETVKWVKISARDSGDKIRIQITSSRLRISDDVRMFLKSMESRSTPSPWLGLAVAKNLIESFGSTFSIATETPSFQVIVEVPKSSTEAPAEGEEDKGEESNFIGRR